MVQYEFDQGLTIQRVSWVGSFVLPIQASSVVQSVVKREVNDIGALMAVLDAYPHGIHKISGQWNAKSLLHSMKDQSMKWKKEYWRKWNFLIQAKTNQVLIRLIDAC